MPDPGPKDLKLWLVRIRTVTINGGRQAFDTRAQAGSYEIELDLKRCRICEQEQTVRNRQGGARKI